MLENKDSNVLDWNVFNRDVQRDVLPSTVESTAFNLALRQGPCNNFYFIWSQRHVNERKSIMSTKILCTSNGMMHAFGSNPARERLRCCVLLTATVLT